MAEAPRDKNRVPCLLATSNADQSTPIKVEADATTKRLLVSATTDFGQDEGAARQAGDAGVYVLGVRQDSQADLGDDGDFVGFSIDADGALRVSGGGGGTQQTVDSALGATPVGTLAIAKRDDALSALTPIEGDAVELRVSSVGSLWVEDINSDDALTSLQLIDNIVQTEDAVHNAGDSGVMALAVRQDTQSDLGDDGDYVPLSIDADGALRVSGGTEYTEDVATPSAIVGNAVMAERDDALSTLTPIEGDWASLRCSAEGALWVQDFNSDAILTALQIMDDWDNAASDGASVSGDVAHDAVDAGEPVKIGGKAVTAPPTAVAANDRVNGMFDIHGRQIVMGSLREMKGSQMTTITASTSETTVVTADATYKLDVYGVLVTNTSATDTEVTFKDDTAGTSRFQISAPANDTRGFMLPIDAAHVQSAVNDNWTATCADSVSSIVITVLYVKNL